VNAAPGVPAGSALDDYLGLLQQPIGQLRLLGFHGASGSGKSSQIALLLQRHPDLAQREVTHATPASLPRTHRDVLVLDELQSLRDCACLGRALRRSRLLMIASHVAPILLWPWRLGRAQRCFQIDPLPHKLARELDRRGVRYSATGLDRFMAQFGANYTDLNIVLEHAAVDDLDRALALFQRGGAIRHG
jgi:hypothetical protein